MKEKKNKKKEQGEKNIVAVEEALSKSEQFIERNQNYLIGIVTVIVLLIAGYMGYTRFILEPREQEAREEMYMAEQHFERDSMRLALEGDGTNLGFLDIIADYRMTKSANLARYYAGIALLNLGEYEEAIDHLKKFRRRDQILGAMALGAIGDAYLEFEDTRNALRYYERAAGHQPNSLTTPAFLMKAGMVYEMKGRYGDALEAYQKIKDEYPNTNEGRNIERFIARARTAAN
ncbi:MAG: tetratricopeptide repeat protein [Bacteroidetes bacterium]|nr:MAG: tetratricopeptide repeat protein [Bacteroidota bacterium]